MRHAPTATLPRLSRPLYSALRADIDADALCPGGDPYEYVEQAIDAARDRFAADPLGCRDPARSLFRDIRWCFPLARQPHVLRLVSRWMAAVGTELESLRLAGFDAAGNPLRCPVFTRQGRQCERRPLPHNGHCPSHQHLAADAQELGAA